MSVTTCTVCYSRNNEYLCSNCHRSIYDLLKKSVMNANYGVEYKLIPTVILCDSDIKNFSITHKLYFCRKRYRKTDTYSDTVMIMDDRLYRDLREGKVYDSNTSMTFPRPIDEKYWKLYDKYNRKEIEEEKEHL